MTHFQVNQSGTNTGDREDDSCSVTHLQPSCGPPTELKLGKTTAGGTALLGEGHHWWLSLFADNRAEAPCLKKERKVSSQDHSRDTFFLIREIYNYFHLQSDAAFLKPYTCLYTIAQEKKKSKLWIYCWARNSNNWCQREVNMHKGAAGRKEKLQLKNWGKEHWTLCV